MSLDPATKKRLPLAAAAATAVVLAIGGFLWWQGQQRWEATDNAFVQADTTELSPQIDGYVVEVLVKDNQRVEPGQVLLRLDDADARAKLAQAEANLQAVLAAVGAVDARSVQEQAVIASRAAAVRQAEAQAALARTQAARYGRLAEQGWVSQQRVQTETASLETAQAGVAEAQAALVAEQRAAGVLGSSREQSLAAVQQARSQVEQARLALDRTVIRAPVAGFIGARGVRVGQYVRPGGPILSVVPLGENTYVVANFKETQLGRLRLGQTVHVKADAFPDVDLLGRVESFAPATGSEFALIPVENATGNFTKITQRVPVRVQLTGREAAVLRPGLSVEVKVDLKSAGGATFAQAAVGDVRTAAVETAARTR